MFDFIQWKKVIWHMKPVHVVTNLMHAHSICATWPYSRSTTHMKQSSSSQAHTLSHLHSLPFNAQEYTGIPFYRNFNSILRRDHQKIFLWTSRLWVGRQKEPILGYVPKNDEKKNLVHKGLKKMKISKLH